jgi:demethylmenaquinone methyltransferase/2-methoxy-6-polyprenyl-1,4-benzoquinol methylase
MDDKRSYVRAMFGRIAPRYDLMNRLMSFGQDQTWRRKTCRLVLQGAGPAPLSLDLATGTGDLAISLLEARPDGTVVGLDLTYGMLALAPAKLRAVPAGMSRISMVNGDSLELPFPDNSFDAITSAFMLRNLVDLDRAFAEMLRVTRPGGRIAALEITRPRLPLWRALFGFYFYRMVPVLGGFITGEYEAYKYLPRSLSLFISPQDLAAIITRAGFQDVRFELLNLGTVAIHHALKPASSGAAG